MRHMKHMSKDERIAMIRRVAKTLGYEEAERVEIPEQKDIDEVFRHESDEDLINLHIRQLGGCTRCEGGR